MPLYLRCVSGRLELPTARASCACCRLSILWCEARADQAGACSQGWMNACWQQQLRTYSSSTHSASAKPPPWPPPALPPRFLRFVAFLAGPGPAAGPRPRSLCASSPRRRRCGRLALLSLASHARYELADSIPAPRLHFQPVRAPGRRGGWGWRRCTAHVAAEHAVQRPESRRGINRNCLCRAAELLSPWAGRAVTEW